MESPKKVTFATAALIGVGVFAASSAGLLYLSNRTKETATPIGAQGSGMIGAVRSGEYKDGTYSATGTYFTPRGKESIDLTVQLSTGTINEVSLRKNATSGAAVEFQERFASNYKPLVIGKKIDEVRLSRVAGSSLTSVGFNKAIEQIKDDAAV